MRDCIAEIYRNGASGERRNYATFLMVVELNRLGYSEADIRAELVEWNKKNDPPFTPREVESNLIKTVGSTLQKGYKVGCRKIAYRGFCLFEPRDQKDCKYCNEAKAFRQKKVRRHYEDNYNHSNWSDHLRAKFYSTGYYADLYYRELKVLEVERDLPPGSPLFIGCRAMAGRILNKYRHHNLDPKTSLRVLKLLVEVGLTKQVSKGKPGTARRFANAYCRVLPIPKPPQLYAE